MNVKIRGRTTANAREREAVLKSLSITLVGKSEGREREAMKSLESHHESDQAE